MLLAITEAVFVVTGVAHLCAVVLLVCDVRRGRVTRPGWVDAFGCAVIGAGCAMAAGLPAVTVGIVAAAGAMAGIVVAHKATALWPAGSLVWTTLLSTTLGGLAAATAHLAGLTVSAPTVVLLACGLVIAVLRMPASLVQLYVTWEVALRHRWRRDPQPRPPAANPPMVTVQVPTYAEPPEVVIGTLDALVRLDYPNFDVMVIDNNTTDERLWKPVQEHCTRLGFRFLHVEGITGAKAGALNWARPHIDPRTELIGLLDADYQVDPRWLADTVPYFDDPELGFVQCPHAYRDYEHSAYGRMVTARYDRHVPDHLSSNEHNASTTIGTMSLIRVATIDKAGGWAEWCQTEDSEFAIRAHAAGYSSQFVNRPHGWGLIPENLVELKKQRFRWTYGPATEFKAHVRLFLPGRLGRPSRLTWPQRIVHGANGLSLLVTGLGVLGLPLGAALLASMVVHGEAPAVSPQLLLPMAAMLLGQRLMRWLTLRLSIGVTVAQYLAGGVALLAVRPTVSTAAFSALVGRPVTWWRTSKFRSAPSVLRGLAATAMETVLTVGCLAAAVVAPLLLPRGLGTWLLALWFGWQAVTYATAPLLAVLAERTQRASTLPDAPPTGGGEMIKDREPA
jgi:cellulose synthase/poly-beta-1,6-N-acetylglucosamine synthase-like glycosyltransferase